MNYFLKKLFWYLILPVIVFFVLEGLLPITSFTYRHYESLIFRVSQPNTISYYPNVNSSMNAVGDLCHHTENAKVKKEIWRTDKLGFRNDSFVEEPDLLFIGDSFIQGCSLSQDETLPVQLFNKKKGKLKIYNMSPSTFSEFDKYLKLKIIKKPKVIVFSMVERENPTELILYDSKDNSSIKNRIKALLNFGNLNVFIDKSLKMYSIEWVKARINNFHGNGFAANDHSGMYFMKDIVPNKDSGVIIKNAEKIISYKKYCDSLNIKFIYLPMPNKETVYFEKVPFSLQPNYLYKLDSILANNHVTTIKTLEIYNNFRKTNSLLLYHKDDTHWNKFGVNLITDELLKNEFIRNP